MNKRPDELSAKNPRILDAAKLLQKKFRRETGCILIEGARLVGDALDAGAPLKELFATSDFLDSDAGRQLAKRGLDVAPISDPAATKLSDTRTNQGVFAIVEFSLPTLDAFIQGIQGDIRHLECLVLVAAGIADPGNLGTMIRSAAALGAACVVASGESCEVLNPKTVRAAMGAVFRIPVVEGADLDDAIPALKARGLQIVAAVAHNGKPPWELDLARPTALLIGSEAEGLSPLAVAMSNAHATVPMNSGTESLNAAGAAAVLLYEAARQRRAP